MDAPVVASVITSAAALVVAIGSGIRSDIRVAIDRTYERRRAFLVDAQDAALGLRDALREYGSALQRQTRADSGTVGSFTMSVPHALSSATAVAQGRLTVAMSRLEDRAVSRALAAWLSVARVSLIDPSEEEASAEQSAFDMVNELIGTALQFAPRQLGRSRRRAGQSTPPR